MSALRSALRPSLRAVQASSLRGLHTSRVDLGRKALAVFYSGGKHAQEEKKLLGTVENKLGLEDWFKQQGFDYVITDDKEGPNSVFQKNLHDTEILITTPFHPAYLTEEIMAKAPNLKLCVTAGVGSDHIDLNAANKRKITVAEVTGSNVQSVAEQVMLCILALVRNYVPAHQQVVPPELGWDVAAVARNAYDLEGKTVGTFGCGRIGQRVLQRLKPFGCKELMWFDYNDVPAAHELGTRASTLEEMLGKCDIITINAPLHEGTKGLFNKELISKMKPGSWLVNTARGAICDRNAVAEALESGHLRGYAGDVWDVQPAPQDHPWRTMTNPLGGGNGMTAHYSGTTIDAQERYAAGTKDIIRRYLAGEAQEPANVIVENGEYATKSYGKRK